MSSIDYPPPSPFICPALRTEDTYPRRELQNQTKKIGEGTYLIIDNSYHVSDTEDDNLSNSRNSNVGDKKVLHSHHLRLFQWCNNKEGVQNDICIACFSSYKIGTSYYICNDCRDSYHKECVESPPIFISPCHPKYPLQLLKQIISSSEYCHCCGYETWGLVYHSSVCDIFLHPVCARKQEFSPINNPKRHEHILHYFPRKASLTCDVCASDDNKRCFYSCLQCDFIVHKRCIDLPRVILIFCHNHRLSFTNSRPSGSWFCGVCRQKIDENYGSYSCTKRCAYAVHTMCATLLDVWAGKELEDQPETEYDNLEPFEEIGDGTIRHFSHEYHRMRLIENIERAFDAKQQYCQACMLSLYDGNVYTCMECDFVLHKACASLPRIKHIGVHPHPLMLKPVPPNRFFFCYYCDRYSCGFVYMCGQQGCFGCYVDVRCASLSELVDHPSHTHPLFLFYKRGTYQKCSTCETGSSYLSLNCVECDFVLCFRCANLPYKVKYEHDEHMLTLSYEKNATSPYWCQACEETADPKKGYYRCNECGVTFHIECILVNDFFMKTGQHFTYNQNKVEIIPNDRLSRPICKTCKRRCQYKIVFKVLGQIFCSIRDLETLF